MLRGNWGGRHPCISTPVTLRDVPALLLWDSAPMRSAALLLALALALTGCSSSPTVSSSPTTITETVTLTTTAPAVPETSRGPEPTPPQLPTMFSCTDDDGARLFQLMRSGDSFTGTITWISPTGSAGDASYYTEVHTLSGSVSGDAFEYVRDDESRGFGTIYQYGVTVNESAPRGDVLERHCSATDAAAWNNVIRNYMDWIDIQHLAGG